MKTTSNQAAAQQSTNSSLDGATLAVNTDAKQPSTATEVKKALSDIVPRFRLALERVASEVVGRDELITQSALALLSREHQLLFSRAGVAKSLYAMCVFKQFSGGNTFSIQMTKGTTEEGVVGAVSIDELKAGRVTHNTKNSLVDANLAFLDEFFDANDVALRSMLGILNERVFKKGQQQEQAKLHTAIATTNYMRQSDVTEAVLDRFVFRSKLTPSEDPITQFSIDKVYEKRGGSVPAPNPDEQITLDELELLADVCEGKIGSYTISAPAHVLILKNAIIETYERVLTEARAQKSLSAAYISPRTMAKARDVLNAAAILDGRQELATKDLKALEFMIPTLGDEMEQQAFKKALADVITPLKKSDVKVLDTLGMGIELVKLKQEHLRSGEVPDTTLLQKVLVFFGFTTIAKISFRDIRSAIETLTPESPLTSQMKDGLLHLIDDNIKRAEEKRGALLL